MRHHKAVPSAPSQRRPQRPAGDRADDRRVGRAITRRYWGSVKVEPAQALGAGTDRPFFV
jgi:hypothetical protein